MNDNLIDYVEVINNYEELYVGRQRGGLRHYVCPGRHRVEQLMTRIVAQGWSRSSCEIRDGGEWSDTFHRPELAVMS